jgi:hypothetical protein
MTPETYLILIRDGRLALAVGAALEDRLQADGRYAVALVPSARGGELGGDHLRQAYQSSLWRSQSPQVVALFEDGLLETLETLGLAAYVGVPRDQGWQVINWGENGAMMLPVASARDLVEAVADYSPWHSFARQPSVSRPERTRKLAMARLAGPLLLGALPAAAAAAVASAPVAVAAATTPSATVAPATHNVVTGTSPAPSTSLAPNTSPVPSTSAAPNASAAPNTSLAPSATRAPGGPAAVSKPGAQAWAASTTTATVGAAQAAASGAPGARGARAAQSWTPSVVAAPAVTVRSGSGVGPADKAVRPVLASPGLGSGTATHATTTGQAVPVANPQISPPSQSLCSPGGPYLCVYVPPTPPPPPPPGQDPCGDSAIMVCEFNWPYPGNPPGFHCGEDYYGLLVTCSPPSPSLPPPPCLVGPSTPSYPCTTYEPFPPFAPIPPSSPSPSSPPPPSGQPPQSSPPPPNVQPPQPSSPPPSVQPPQPCPPPRDVQPPRPSPPPTSAPAPASPSGPYSTVGWVSSGGTSLGWETSGGTSAARPAPASAPVSSPVTALQPSGSIGGTGTGITTAGAAADSATLVAATTALG